jgi:hypothetical protein
MELDIDQEGILGYGNDDCGFIYVPIPKNAHTTYKKFFAEKYGMDKPYLINIDTAKKSFKYKRLIVILRDPIKRWVSGTAQYFFQCPEKLEDPLMVDLIFKVVDFDHHVGRQTQILDLLDISRCIFFYQSPDLHKNISTFCKKYITDIAPDHQYKEYNIATEIPEKIKIIEKLSILINENSSYKQRLEEYYEKDIRLINDLLTTGRDWHYVVPYTLQSYTLPTYKLSTRLKFYGTD